MSEATQTVDGTCEVKWAAQERIVARAVLRSRHPGNSDAEFNRSWDISPNDWRWQYLEGVSTGFKEAGLCREFLLADSLHMAAPDLLAALKTAIDIIGHPDDEMTKHFVEVVSKAEGRAP